MATNKTPRKAAERPAPVSPSAPAEKPATALESASAPRPDPGPPPRMPVMPSGDPVAQQVVRAVIEAMRPDDTAGARALVRQVSTLRASPAACRYKAEVLAWLDALDAYRAGLER